MLNKEPPTLEGAPVFPGQKTWIRYRVANGRVVGVWAMNAHEDAIELPLTALSHGFGVQDCGQFDMSISDRYVSAETP